MTPDNFLFSNICSAKRRKKAGGKENDPLPKKSKVQPKEKPQTKKLKKNNKG